MQLFSSDATIFKKKIPKNIENLPWKVPNWLGLTFFSPASFCFALCNSNSFIVSYFLIFEVITLCRIKNGLEFLWCRYNSILLYSTQLPIIRWKWGILHLVLYSSGNFASQTPGFSWGIGSRNSWRFHNWAKTHSLSWSKVSLILFEAL